MRERSLRWWSRAAVLAAGVLLGTGCRALPETGGGFVGEDRGNIFANRKEQPGALLGMEGGKLEGSKTLPWEMRADRGYNGTIQQIGSSIDPRTPQTNGQQAQSRWDDQGGMMQDRYSALGGATYSPAAWGLGGEDGARTSGAHTYGGSGGSTAPLGWQDRNDESVR